MEEQRAAVLLMAYGAAERLEDIPAYLQDIRGGRPAPQGLVQGVIERYKMIGGRSPLIEITLAQGAALEKELRAQGCPAVVRVGMRHSRPTIAEAVRAFSLEGQRSFVALPLTPYESSMSSGAYYEKLAAAVQKDPGVVDFTPVGAWHGHPMLIAAFADRIREAARRIPLPLRKDIALILTAHSLPSRIATGEPYPIQFMETAGAAARAAGFTGFNIAYQSKRMGAQEDWLGPAASEVITELAEQGVRAVLIAPIGFLSDHLETLYDDDIELRALAEEKGMAFARAEALNTHPAFIGALADTVRKHLKR